MVQIKLVVLQLMQFRLQKVCSYISFCRFNTRLEVTDSGLQSDIQQLAFITATGGTITTCGNFKIHTFTGPGTFTVICSVVSNPAGKYSRLL